MRFLGTGLFAAIAASLGCIGPLLIAFASVEFDVQGMTCSTCEHHVVSAINLMPGIIEATTSYSEGKAYATYDLSAISKEELAASIAKETGSKVLKSIMNIN